MDYMVIETFTGGADAVYARFHAKGRMLPGGLHYVDSWLTEDRARCFQLMRCDDPALFDVWTANWRDLVEFEIVPLAPAADKGREPVSSPPGT